MKVDKAKTSTKRLGKKPSPKTDQVKKPGKKPLGGIKKPGGQPVVENPTDQITLSKKPGNLSNRAQSTGMTEHIGALMEAFGMQS